MSASYSYVRILAYLATQTHSYLFTIQSAESHLLVVQSVQMVQGIPQVHHYPMCCITRDFNSQGITVIGKAMI